MSRLRVVVEGQTEEAFVNAVLVPHLRGHGVFASASIVGKVVAGRRGHRQRGGGHYVHWREDLLRHLRGDRSSGFRVTTLFDLYGLPKDFPGLGEHGALQDTNRRCDLLQDALAADLGDRRLIPYLQRHEFEALVLAALPSLRDVLDAKDELEGLDRLEASVGQTPPEDINDGTDTAPSKRLLDHLPGYEKTLHGPLATEDAGLSALRARCPRFDAWVTSLEALGAEGAE